MSIPPLWYEFRNVVHCGEFEAAEKLLKETPSLLYMTNGLGETALHFLAVEDDQKGVAWLHAKGSDINTRNKFGTPVLFEVAQLGYKSLFVWFVENGADLRIRDARDQDIVDYLLEYDKGEMAGWVRTYSA